MSDDTFSSITTSRYTPFSPVSSRLGKATAGIDADADDIRGPLGLNILCCPPEALLDIIFVHGLGGGSRKTWSKTASVTHYWPQEWLPRDPAFKNARIHSFGYNSDWAKGKENCLNIHHFGKSLLGELITSPYMISSNLPIIFVGHSMGGLVIKQAYMLARQNTAYDSLAKRFHTICFLATPHRGSNSAKLLNNVLQITYQSRAYVAELEANSRALQNINDEFRNYSADVVLWSFYETQKVTKGLFSALIVDPQSATLGYPQEEQIPMNADHRSICKFDTITDPNYIIIRNSLASIIHDIEKLELKSKRKQSRTEELDLGKYLGVSEELDDDLVTADDEHLPGTCEWFGNKTTYQQWKNFDPNTPQILWVSGKPAAGKSVLAGYTIRQLQQRGTQCSYFFFKYGDKSKSGLSACLRSIALQMAHMNDQVRDALLEMQKNDVQFDKDNERTIWRKLFLSAIFKTRLDCQYWIIDALDECINFTSLFDLLGKLSKSTPLRIFITSRETPGLEKGFAALGNTQVQCEKISPLDTLPDIRLMVEVRTKSLAVKDEIYKASLVEKILEKSNGSFLWTVLVLKELTNTYSKEEVNQVLADVPRDMEPLYLRTLDLMSKATRGKELTKSILIWTTSAIRPLSTQELECALQVDIKDNFFKFIETVTELCGQLVTIDKFGKVQMVHETAREFLLNGDLKSEFAISKQEAHTRIARTCLVYLTGDEMKPPRNGRRPSHMITIGKRSEFSLYACTSFSYHLAKADPLANDVLALVDKFLRSNVLSWIEFIAQTKDLAPLIRVSKNLRKYLASCTAERSPLGTELETIRGWTVDFFRITAKFADALIVLPSAIHSSILPFCPTDSAAYQLAKTGRRVSVVGLTNSQWNDRLSCVSFHNQTSAVCYGDEFLAVGITTGEIALYHASSCQEYKTLNHGEAVRFLEFKIKSDLMASCGMKSIRVWDVRSGQTVHCFQAPRLVISLAFDHSVLFAACNQNFLSSWDLDEDGTKLPDRAWNTSTDQLDGLSSRPPRAISISTSHKMLALAYTRQPIVLWDLEGDAYFGTCGKKLPDGETSTHAVSTLAFNPNLSIPLLVVSYLDGELVLLDPFNDEEIENVHANCHTLSVSPDGRFLAGGAGDGMVHIYEFDTLRLLYRVKSANYFIKHLTFSRDNLHFADIRGSQCNIWEPAVLLRELTGDDISEGTSTSVVEMVAPEVRTKISAMVVYLKYNVIFCGKEDGSVCVHDIKTGALLQALYSHKSRVHILAWWPRSEVIMSVDASNTVHAWHLKKLKNSWVPDYMVFQNPVDIEKSTCVIQLLPNEEARKLVLSTQESDYLWNIDGQQENSRAYSKSPRIRGWAQHPTSPSHIICVDGVVARIYTWDDWSEIGYISLGIAINNLQLKRITSYTSGLKQWILIEQSELNGSATTCAVHLVDAGSLEITEQQTKAKPKETVGLVKSDSSLAIREKASPASKSTKPIIPHLTTLSHSIAHIIGVSDTGNIIFLSTQSWVCSITSHDLKTSALSYTRHFFVPYDWFSGTRDIICTVSKRDVIFARSEDVVIVKGGLEFIDSVT